PVRTRHPREYCLVGPAGEVLPELLRRAFPG
ncbi:NAD-dependent deacylase, partial [Pseudomonas aeruginosa]